MCSRSMVVLNLPAAMAMYGNCMPMICLTSWTIHLFMSCRAELVGGGMGFVIRRFCVLSGLSVDKPLTSKLLDEQC
jgi:hypothetical protein